MRWSRLVELVERVRATTKKGRGSAERRLGRLRALARAIPCRAAVQLGLGSIVLGCAPKPAGRRTEPA